MHAKTSVDRLAETTADSQAETLALAAQPAEAPADRPAKTLAAQPAEEAAGRLTRLGPARSSDFKALHLKLERMLNNIERIEESMVLLETVVQILVRDFRDDLGFELGWLYRREGLDYYLCCAFGGSPPMPIGHRVPREHPSHVRTITEGLLIMRKGDPGYDELFASAIGVNTTFAAIAVGPGSTHVLAFSVDAEIDEEQVLYSLWAVRHVINMKLQQGKLAGIIEEARINQETLLPSASLQFAGYEIYGHSRPAEVVSGDLYDYLPRRDRLLGVAIADASGHGLPASLLARDVIIGLRMGMSEKSRVSRTVERLNRVIHRAALSSKFISLFYCEFGPGGSLVYCNAGHNPPLHQRGTTLRPLERGGLILGPNPAARYSQGRARMQSGDVVVLYTDGLIEREDPEGKQYGLARLKRLLPDMPDTSARERVEAIFADGDQYAGGAVPQDDMTVVVVRRA
jgi:sigma-B regulation protein RsbU (phosphoserine phosphatase)